jgi:hypothetical protein
VAVALSSVFEPPESREAGVDERPTGVEKPFADTDLLPPLDLFSEQGEGEPPERVAGEANGEREERSQAVPLVRERA